MSDLDPIIINLPNVPGPKLPLIERIKNYFAANSARSTKIITAVSAIVIALSMIGFVVFTVITNNASFKKQHHISVGGQIVPDQASGIEKSADALPGAGTVVGKSVNTGTNSPVVTLSATPSSLNIGGKSHLKWSVTNNPKSCVASDDWTGTKSNSSEEDTPALTKLQTYIFTLTCKTDTGTGYSQVSISTTQQIVTGDAAKAPVVTISAAPTLVYQGFTTTLQWSVTNNPTSCTASGDWSGAKNTSGGTETTAALTQIKGYTFTLKCSNNAGTGTQSIPVTVQAVPPDIPAVGITSATQSPVTPGALPTLTWTTVNAPTSCTASGDWTGAKSVAGGSQQVPAALTTIGKNYTYTITCTNSAGSTTDTISFTVVPNPPQVSLSVSAVSSWPYVGGTANISWSATNTPTSCTASGDWTGTFNTTSGTQTVSLSSAKTYLFSLDCQNAGGHGFQNNVPLSVSLPAVPVATISVSPISITTGSSATVTWSSTNHATSCTPTGNASWVASALSKQTSGTYATGVINTAGTYTYSIACTNPGGTGSVATASLTVSAAGVPVSIPVVTISVSPTSIGTGSSSTISWSATNSPTSCTASNTAGAAFTGSAFSASGSTSTGTLNTAGTYTFSMFCSNSAGNSTTASATLTVQAVPTATISVSPNPITAGGTTTVTWSTSPVATACTSSGTGWAAASNKAGSGTQTVTLATAGTYTFSIQCTNAAGTGALVSTSVTVNAAATQYCVVSGVAKPQNQCFGPTTLNAHKLASDCWAYVTNKNDATDKRVYSISSMNSGYHKTQQQNLLPTNGSTVAQLCGAVDVYTYINGTTITGIAQGHKHSVSALYTNTDTIMNTYQQGWYDANSPN